MRANRRWKFRIPISGDKGTIEQMAVTRFRLYVDDPEPVFQWLAEHGGENVVRKKATLILPGWNVKVALSDASLSEAFKLKWANDLLTLENQMKWLAQRRALSPTRRAGGVVAMFRKPGS